MDLETFKIYDKRKIYEFATRYSLGREKVEHMLSRQEQRYPKYVSWYNKKYSKLAQALK